jgi:hypothetical protein
MTEPHIHVERTLTRRRLVLSGGAAVAGLYVMGGLPAVASAVTTAPAYLRRSSYTSYKGVSFSAIGPTGATVALRLLEVSDLVRAKQTRSLVGSDAAFALSFSGPAAKPLGSGIRQLRHPTLGWVSLFITPAGRATATEQRYDVVVDRAGTP